MSGRIVLLGFDAMDPGMVRALAAQGRRLPNFAQLLQRAAHVPVRNPVGLYVGTLWSTFLTGCSGARTGFHCWEEIVPETYERRLTSAEQISGAPFWEALGDAGRRVAVIDVPHSDAGRELNGVAISEWGCHDRHFGLRTYPPELAGELAKRYGFHAVLGADPWAVREWAPDDYLFRAGPRRTPQEDAQLLDALLQGARAKAALSCDLLAEEPWDLFVSVFGETHSAGHQLWHVHDPSHRRHDPQLRARIGDPLVRVYEEMDGALASHLQQLDDEVTVLVLLSHGIGPHHDGTHLLPEILRLLDASYRRERRSSPRRRAAAATWSRLPAGARRRLGPGLAARLRARPTGAAIDDESDEQRRRQLFFKAPNNFVIGGVRVNRRGREADGKVEPGPELDRLLERLSEDLLALVNVQTGAPVISSVLRTDAYYPRSPEDRLPDLFLEWNYDHPIETVWSPRFGTIHGLYEHWRTGDHRADGLLLVRDGALPAGAKLPPIDVEDLAPTIAAGLGVALDDVDGSPVSYLYPSSVA